MSIKQQLAQAIESLPEDAGLEETIERIYLVYQIRSALAQAQESRAHGIEQVMQLAGAWADMPDEEYSGLTQELAERRRGAFASRRTPG